MGMDSIMEIEIQQKLEREFDIFLTAQDIRTLNFAKLNKMATRLVILLQRIKDLDFILDILLKLDTKKEVDRGNIFLLLGIYGCFSVYKSIASGIKSSATCLQHSALNIPDNSVLFCGEISLFAACKKF